MQTVSLGTRVQSLGINRVNIAAGTKVRVVLLDHDAKAKDIYFDKELKKSVEITQEQFIQTGLRPNKNLYLLVAKLNTDMSGRVCSSDYTVEYLRMTTSTFGKFSDSCNENPNFGSITLTAEKKGEFNVITPTPSSWAPEGELAEKINSLRSNKTMIEQLWKLVDADTSISYEEYSRIKNGINGQGTPAIGGGYSAPALAAPSAPATPSAPADDMPAFGESNTPFAAPSWDSNSNDW